MSRETAPRFAGIGGHPILEREKGMKRGDRIVYRCLAGFRYDAEVRAVRLDGRLDVAIDAGANDPVELTRIEFVEPADLRPGTCSTGNRERT